MVVRENRGSVKWSFTNLNAGSFPAWARDFLKVQTGSAAQPAFYLMVTGAKSAGT
jgi:hypothetical protein